MITGLKLFDTGEQQKRALPENAKKAYARPAYPDIKPRAECRVYYETECGLKNCCFECMKRFVCKEFEGGCDRYTRATYKNCPKIIEEARRTKSLNVIIPQNDTGRILNDTYN